MSATTADKVLNALQSHGLQQERNGEYRCNRPWSNGSDSKGLALKIEDGEHGTYYDHVADEGGSLYDLAQRLSISTNSHNHPIPSQEPPKADTNLSEYAKTHGVKPIVFRQAGWFEATHPTDKRLGMVFPTSSGDRWRFLDGRKPKFKSPLGYKPCWYGLEKAVEMAEREGKPLVICNGEPSVIVAQHYGIPACAMTSGERKSIPDSLEQQLRAVWKGDILIVPDNDDTGEGMALGLSRQLSQAGYNVFSIRLSGHKGFDLADFCALHREDSAKALYELDFVAGEKVEDNTTAGQFKLRSPLEIASKPIKPWLIDQIIGEKDLVMIWGSSSTGKTFVVLDMLAQLARGSGKFAGQFTVNRPANVLYMTAEGLSGLVQRIQALLKAINFTSEELDRMKIIEEVVNFANSGAKNYYTNFLTAIEAQKFTPDVIVIDHLSSTIPGFGDIDQKAATLVSEAISEIHRVTNSAVILIHHAGYNDAHHRGASNYKDILDVQIQTKGEQNTRTMKCTKNKDGDYWKDISYNIVPVAGTDSCVVEWIAGPPPREGTALDYVVTYITSNGPSTITEISLSTTAWTNSGIKAAVDRGKKSGVLKVVDVKGKAEVYGV
jgi:hypothetical protein